MRKFSSDELDPQRLREHVEHLAELVRVLPEYVATCSGDGLFWLIRREADAIERAAWSYIEASNPDESERDPFSDDAQRAGRGRDDA